MDSTQQQGNVSQQVTNLSYQPMLLGSDGNTSFIKVDNSANTITVTVLDSSFKQLRAFTIPMELPLYGTAALGADGSYYMLYGKNVTDEQPKEVNIILAKYSSTGTKQGSASFTAEETNTTRPFDTWKDRNAISASASNIQGSASITINDNVIAAYFTREMFKGESSASHQASTAVYVKADTLQKVLHNFPSQSFPWFVGHSIEQKVIATSDGSFLFVDKGDSGFTRGFALHKLLKSGNFSDAYATSLIAGTRAFVPFHFRELSPYQATASTLGGVAELANGYLLIGSSDRVYSKTAVSVNQTGTRDLFMQIIKKDFTEHSLMDSAARMVSSGETRSNGGDSKHDTDFGVVWLTSYVSGENVEYPTLVRTDAGYAILWEKSKVAIDTAPYSREIYYMLIDNNGAVVKQATRIDDGPSLRTTLNSHLVWYYGGHLYWVADNGDIHSLKIAD